MTNPSQFTSLTLRLLRDDGAAVYLNGTEIIRDNLDDGEAFDDFAAQTTGSEATCFDFTASASRLVAGVNVIAVEVHQASPTSSDLSMNLELLGSVIEGGDIKPLIADVILSSSDWTESFLTQLNIIGLGLGGFSLPLNAAQTEQLSWSNIDQVTVVFSDLNGERPRSDSHAPPHRHDIAHRRSGSTVSRTSVGGDSDRRRK